MTTPECIQRRTLIKFATVASVTPSLVFSRPGDTAWPWLLRFFGLRAVRSPASRSNSRRGKRQLRNRLSRIASNHAVQAMVAYTGKTLFSAASNNWSAISGLRELLVEGDQVIVPEARIDRAAIEAMPLPILETGRTRAVYLDVPPLSQSIQDRVTWGVVDVLNGEITRIGQSPIRVAASENNATLELPLGYLMVTGPHQFIATLDEHAESVPILSTTIMEVR